MWKHVADSDLSLKVKVLFCIKPHLLHFDVQKELNGFFTCVSCSIYQWSCSIANHFYYYELLINAHSLKLRKKGKNLKKQLFLYIFVQRKLRILVTGVLWLLIVVNQFCWSKRHCRFVWIGSVQLQVLIILLETYWRGGVTVSIVSHVSLHTCCTVGSHIPNWGIFVVWSLENIRNISYFRLSVSTTRPGFFFHFTFLFM